MIHDSRRGRLNGLIIIFHDGEYSRIALQFPANGINGIFHGPAGIGISFGHTGKRFFDEVLRSAPFDTTIELSSHINHDGSTFQEELGPPVIATVTERK